MTWNLMDVSALTAEKRNEPSTGEQWCVVDPDGERHIYGDQDWIKSHEALNIHPEGSHIEHRSLTITYGEWVSTEKPVMNRAGRIKAQVAHIEEHREAWERYAGKNVDVAEYMAHYGSYERWNLYQRLCDDLGIDPRSEICHPNPED
jgi:hypothetical protein